MHKALTHFDNVQYLLSMPFQLFNTHKAISNDTFIEVFCCMQFCFLGLHSFGHLSDFFAHKR